MSREKIIRRAAWLGIALAVGTIIASPVMQHFLSTDPAFNYDWNQLFPGTDVHYPGLGSWIHSQPCHIYGYPGCSFWHLPKSYPWYDNFWGWMTRVPGVESFAVISSAALLVTGLPILLRFWFMEHRHPGYTARWNEARTAEVREEDEFWAEYRVRCARYGEERRSARRAIRKSVRGYLTIGG